MRHLADINSRQKAEAFIAYLLTKGISTHVESEKVDPSQSTYGDERWSVWIRDEDRISEAKQELEAFLTNPNDERYRTAIQEARSIVNKQREEAKAREKNIAKVKQYTRSASPVGGKMPPITLAIIIICVIMGLLTEFSDPSKNNAFGIMAMKELKFVDMVQYRETGDPAYSIKNLELWRIFTPAFLHGGTLHLILNMFSFASLGRLTERLEGPKRFLTILAVTAMGAHLLQGLLPPSMWGTPNFVGISGVVLGLFGYLAVKSQSQGNAGFYFPPDAYLMVAVLVGIGFLSPGMGLANMAHLGGLVVGALLALVMNKS